MKGVHKSNEIVGVRMRKRTLTGLSFEGRGRSERRLSPSNLWMATD